MTIGLPWSSLLREGYIFPSLATRHHFTSVWCSCALLLNIEVMQINKQTNKQTNKQNPPQVASFSYSTDARYDNFAPSLPVVSRHLTFSTPQKISNLPPALIFSVFIISEGVWSLCRTLMFWYINELERPSHQRLWRISSLPLGILYWCASV